MFRNVIYKQINFLKNNTTEGGALHQIISELKSSEKVIHINNKNEGRLWGKCSEDKLLDLVKKNIGLYEVIADFPVKLYFDIDETDDKQGLQYFKDIIHKYISDAKLSISGSETNVKNSYHIVINNYKIGSYDELQQFKAFIKYLNKTYNKAFDPAVYGKNNNMKAINQSKRESPDRVQNIIEDDIYKNHLITSFIDSSAKSILDITDFDKYIYSYKIEKLGTLGGKLNILDLPDVEIIDSEKILKGDLAAPKEILFLLPINKDFNTQYTFKIMTWAKSKNLLFNDFWTWYSRKNDSKDKYKSKLKSWDNVDLKYTPSDNSIFNIIRRYYPNFDLLKETYDFKQLCNISKEKYISIDYLDKSHFKFEDNKALILNLGMGSGKTEQTMNFIKQQLDLSSDNNIIWMAPNIALSENTNKRMIDNEIKVTLYNTIKKASDKSDLLNNAKNLIICLNSLHYIYSKKYKIVIIDEVETFLKNWVFNDTLHTVKNDCYNNFIRILQEADKIIFLDAFITNITIDFLKDLNISYKIIKKNIKPDSINYRVTERTAIKYNSYNNILNDLIDKIKKNKKVLIFYPYKKASLYYPAMSDLLLNIEKISGKRGLCHNADSDDKIKQKLRDTNKEWINYDFIISNNVITVGLNFDVKYFHQVYLFIGPFNRARDMVQFSYRARTLLNNTVNYCYLNGRSNSDNLDIFDIDTPEYKKLRTNTFVENSTKIRYSFTEFLIMANYILIDADETKLNGILKNDFVKFDDDAIYKFSSIGTILNDSELKEAEKEFYSINSTLKTKLLIKKYHYMKSFKQGTAPEVLSEIWDNNYINLVGNIQRIIMGNENILNKLKEEYKWELHLPNEINDGFKLTPEILELVFNNGFCSRSLTKDSKNHNIIIKSFLNHYYNHEVIKSMKNTKNNNKTEYYINEEFKKIYIMIQNNIIEIKKADNDIYLTDDLFINDEFENENNISYISNMEDTNDIIKTNSNGSDPKEFNKDKDKTKNKDKAGRPKKEIFSTNSLLDAGTPGYRPNFTIQFD